MTTIEQIRAMRDDFLPAAVIAEAIRMAPDRLRQYARENKLPFPYRISGNRVTVSRIGFLNWIEGKKPEPEETRAEKLMADLIKEIQVQNAVMMGILIHLSPEVAGSIMDKCKEVSE